jgi:hypothetical protein
MVMLEKTLWGSWFDTNFLSRQAASKIHSPRTGLLNFICLDRIFRVFELVINTQQ